jgi:NAD(P)H dehydrogenase (quinone)
VLRPIRFTRTVATISKARSPWPPPACLTRLCAGHSIWNCFGKFDQRGVVRGPAGNGRGAFIAREDTARVAAAALLAQPAGIVEVTGREQMTLHEMASRLSEITGRGLQYEEEAPPETARRLSRTSMPRWAQDAEVDWFRAIAAGEQAGVSHGYQGLTGMQPLNMEQYCSTVPEVVEELRAAA